MNSSTKPLPSGLSSPQITPDSASGLSNVGTVVENHSDSMTPLPSDDIPEALRDSTVKRSPSFQSQGKFPIVWMVLIGAGAIALGAITALLWQPIAEMANRTSAQTPAPQNATLPESAQSGQDNAESVVIEASTDTNAGEILGHKPYQEVDEDLLVPLVGDGSVRLRPSAAESFAEMVGAARADGVRLQPLSGFRTEEEQSYLFFEIRKRRRQGLAERAAVSAPPGYSEHHTGYAVDIGDATQPATNVSESFETTEAFKWLQENAASYSFEMSFAGGENDKVSYEPWHWRFVGDRHSLETFYGDSLSDPSNQQDTEQSPNAASQEPAVSQQDSEQSTVE
ncbi:MAG: M15 family metallopeptidase [Cyanobacteria bacterium P01_F01_bin.150]